MAADFFSFVKNLRVTRVHMSSAAALLIATAFLTACDSSLMVDGSKPDNHDAAPVVYSVNPFEYFGQQHNLIVDILEDSLNASNLPSSLSHSAFDSILVARSTMAVQLSGVAPNMTIARMDSIYTLGNSTVWRNVPGHHAAAVSIVQSAGFSQLDSVWTIKVLNLINASNVNKYSVAQLGDSILYLESQIMSQNWSQSDWLALSSIAIYKHSYNFWVSRVDPSIPIISSVGSESKYVGTNASEALSKSYARLQGKAKGAAFITTVVGSDVIGGICAAGLATPVGGPLAIGAGISGAGHISSAVASVWGMVDYAGQNMGWWN